MILESGNIVEGILPNEAVIIDKVKDIGGRLTITFIGSKSQKRDSRIVTIEQAQKYNILTNEGEFNFSGDAHRFKLYAEAERINSAYQFDPLFAINCSIVDPLPHQVEAVYKYLLPQPKIRFLLADDTGAGKTIMTGLLLKEMIMRNQIERVLIVTPGGLTKQWQEDEMMVKFNLPFRLVNRQVLNSEPYIFTTSNLLVASIDFLSQDDVRNSLAGTSWDMVVFDEAHKLSAYDYGTKIYTSRRYAVAKLLSEQTEHLLLLTATPHRGRSDTFKRLMQLLDEDIFATEELAAERVKEFSQNGANKFFIRRLKEDMKDWRGNPLYKDRSTRTVTYELTYEEKKLYEAVTEYLTKRKEEAANAKNIHVSLALAVMQRRLTSSIYAIKNTLERRWHTLQSLCDELTRNPELWKKRQKLDDIDITDLDSYDELDDNERDSFDTILSDPKKFKLFTTAKSIQEIQEEAESLKVLYTMANNLYVSQQEEQKYKKLKELLKTERVLDGQKLVIFTEHRDTLNYLNERLSNLGYKVAAIHGGMNVDERRQSQVDFAQDNAQILIATDAAGEGINLQFCQLLINWDIPWNPNRLEQRMGRIHRYGQKEDVLVINMVASNTREGKVLHKLLEKLDIIRKSLGDDRVYDVIQDVFKGVSMEAIMSSVFDGRSTELNRFLDQDITAIQDLFKKSIEEQESSMAHSKVDFKDAINLKVKSDETRLQPIYIRNFFEDAFAYLGGKFTESDSGIFEITCIPSILEQRLKAEHKINVASAIGTMRFCFDKSIFLDAANAANAGNLYYINPGNALFDALIKTVLSEYKTDMLKGTVLVSPSDSTPYLAYFLRSQITDGRATVLGDSVSSERLSLICEDAEGVFRETSPAKLIDLCPPTEFAKQVQLPAIVNKDNVEDWALENITTPLYNATLARVQDDVENRRRYLEDAFTEIISDITVAIEELNQKMLLGDENVADKIQQKQLRIQALSQKRSARLEVLNQTLALQIKIPEVLGCAYVVPLSQMEYESAYNMHRDDEVEAIGMQVAMDYERTQGRTPEDVSAKNVGYDVHSVDKDGNHRYIEVKGRAHTDGVMLSSNEWNRLNQLGDNAWLYVVTDCKSTPKLKTIQNPAKVLTPEIKTKGVQYFVTLNEIQNA